jgi:hypothetical protein
MEDENEKLVSWLCSWENLWRKFVSLCLWRD